jgi:hypothetical protein
MKGIQVLINGLKEYINSYVLKDYQLPKTVVKSINSIKPDQKGNVSIPKQIQADMSQQDTSAPDYIRNKTHGVELVDIVVIDSQTLNQFTPVSGTLYKALYPDLNPLNLGDTYKIVWDGVLYELTVRRDTATSTNYIGNADYVAMNSGGDIPFAIVFAPTENYVIIDSDVSSVDTHIFSISYSVEVVHTIDPKYIDLPIYKGAGIDSVVLNCVDNKAIGDHQHVQGKYNIQDDKNQYAHIVGNGEDLARRSNAHTLDWDGNAWYAGNVYVGGTNQDNAEKLVTPQDMYAPRSAICLADQSNEYRYIMYMKDGNIITEPATNRIIASGLEKRDYVYGEAFDPTGMIVTAISEIGDQKEVIDFQYPANVFETGWTPVTYVEAGIPYIDTNWLDVEDFNPKVHLIDFDYTDNEDGTYTITRWKGTLNGERSTEMIIPDNCNIILQEV